MSTDRPLDLGPGRKVRPADAALAAEPDRDSIVREARFFKPGAGIAFAPVALMLVVAVAPRAVAIIAAAVLLILVVATALLLLTWPKSSK